MNAKSGNAAITTLIAAAVIVIIIIIIATGKKSDQTVTPVDGVVTEETSTATMPVAEMTEEVTTSAVVAQ